MNSKIKILSICGSTRNESTNRSLINAIKVLYVSKISFSDYTDLEKLPQFNPDKDNENTAEAVTEFRNMVKDADAVLICTPEYAMGVPGALKNAIDWTVSSCEFSGKPVALITASSLGEKAHASLLATLLIIEATIKGNDLLISFAGKKINKQNEITDETTVMQVINLMDNFINTIRHK